MDRAGLLGFLRGYKLAVLASRDAGGAPQAAVVGFAVSDDLELVFDTLDHSRKARNLGGDPRVALVIGGQTWGEERTVQYEGVADVPTGPELERLRELYFERFPDGRERLASWPGLIHVRVRPTWIRYSDFERQPPEIVELTGDELRTP
jgi:general stress protein 26